MFLWLGRVTPLYVSKEHRQPDDFAPPNACCRWTNLLPLLRGKDLNGSRAVWPGRMSAVYHPHLSESEVPIPLYLVHVIT